MRSTMVVLAVLAGQFHGGLTRPAAERFPPGIATTEPNPEYPLKVRVLTAARHQKHSVSNGLGSGNLLGDPMVGFDFKYDCDFGFLKNPGKDEFYWGKWKKQDKKIEILTHQPGSDRVDKCTMDVTVKDAPYGKDNPPPVPEKD